jgi:hypothetical protein
MKMKMKKIKMLATKRLATDYTSLQSLGGIPIPLRTIPAGGTAHQLSVPPGRIHEGSLASLGFRDLYPRQKTSLFFGWGLGGSIPSPQITNRGGENVN